MTDQTKNLDSEIAKLEASIGEKTARLQVAVARWDDWRAGNLRAAIGREQLQLHDLKAQRAALAPLEAKHSRAIFYGSNH